MQKSGSYLLCQSKHILKKYIFCETVTLRNIINNKTLQGNRFCSLCFIATRLKSTSPQHIVVKDLVPEEKDMVSKKRLFKQMTSKDKTSFLNVIQSFSDKGGGKRGHIEFIYAALHFMEEYNVQADLEVYKKLMDVFPKGKMIPKNLIQAEFYHFARHQDCGIELLDQMEYNCVFPDIEMKEIVLNIFGKSSHVYKKYARMLYWMPKLKNKNPYLPLEPLTSDTEQLARLALQKMSIDLRTKISHFKTKDLKDAVDQTWIVSSQSPVQQKLLLDHPVDQPLYVEGAYLVWLRKLSLSYFVLRADPPLRPTTEVDKDDVSNLSLYMFGESKPIELMTRPQTIHEQEDATIFAMCATGTSSKDSVLSWINILRKTNPVLDNIPILFTLKSAPSALTTVNAPHQDFGDVKGSSETITEKQSNIDIQETSRKQT